MDCGWLLSLFLSPAPAEASNPLVEVHVGHETSGWTSAGDVLPGEVALVRVTGPPSAPFHLRARTPGGRRALLRHSGRLDDEGVASLALRAPRRPELVGQVVAFEALVLDAGTPERALPATLRVVSRPSGPSTKGAFEPHPFRIVTCSLACTSDGPGEEFSCSVFAVPTQATLRFEFTRAIDAASISLQTVRVLDVSTGQAVPGTLSLESRGHELVWRGTLELNETYQVTIPGKNQDPAGPHLTSARGARPNLDRLRCSFVAL